MKTAFVIALANLSSSSLAFSPNSICSSYTSDRSSTKLHSFALDNDVDAVYLLAKADECAHSETCSIDDAEHYLNELVHIQGNCASGQLQSSAVCEDIQYPSEIMASLRYKIENKIYKPNTFLTGSDVSPLILAAAAAYVTVGAFSMHHSPGVDTFTAQEVWWAAKDGYLGELISQYAKNGGLAAVDDNALAPLSFTPQEWFWSIRDGYFGDMVSTSIRDGGLIPIDSTMDSTRADPFIGEELVSSVKDGYLSNMISHYMKHGGL